MMEDSGVVYETEDEPAGQGADLYSLLPSGWDMGVTPHQPPLYQAKEEESEEDRGKSEEEEEEPQKQSFDYVATHQPQFYPMASQLWPTASNHATMGTISSSTTTDTQGTSQGSNLYSFLPPGWGSGSISQNPHAEHLNLPYTAHSVPRWPSEELEVSSESEGELHTYQPSQPHQSNGSSPLHPASSSSPSSEQPDIQKPASTSSASEATNPYPARPHWVEDQYAACCAKCSIDFSTFKRRHHCRACGKVFCNGCSNKWLLLPKEFGYTTVQRLCAACFRSHSTIDFSTTEDVFGPADAPLIVLLHGAGVTRKSWRLQVEELQEHYRLVIPDLPAHGAREDQPLTMNATLDMLEKLIRAHSSDNRAIIFGYSFGAYVAMTLAGCRPYLCRALILGGAGSNFPRAGLVMGLVDLACKTLPSGLLARSTPYTLYNTQVSTEVVNELFLRPVSIPLVCPWPNCCLRDVSMVPGLK